MNALKVTICPLIGQQDALPKLPSMLPTTQEKTNNASSRIVLGFMSHTASWQFYRTGYRSARYAGPLLASGAAVGGRWLSR